MDAINKKINKAVNQSRNGLANGSNLIAKNGKPAQPPNDNYNIKTHNPDRENLTTTSSHVVGISREAEERQLTVTNASIEDDIEKPKPSPPKKPKKKIVVQK